MNIPIITSLPFSKRYIPKTFIKISYDRTFSMKYHTHQNMEFAYLVSGKMKVALKDAAVYNLFPGQFALIHKNRYHKLVADSDDIELIVFELAPHDEKINIDNYIINDPFFAASPTIKDLFLSNEPIIVFSDTDNVRETLSHIVSLLDENRRGIQNEFFEMDYEISIKKLIISLCKCRTEHLKVATNSYINHAINFIGNHYAENITTKDIAKAIGVTPSYAQKLFFSSTGRTIMKTVNFYRLKQSQYLIATTRLSFIEIAKMTGFNTENNLYKNFKNYCNCSPSERRKRFNETIIAVHKKAKSCAKSLANLRLSLF